jgi:hypothetical protein
MKSSISESLDKFERLQPELKGFKSHVGVQNIVFAQQVIDKLFKGYIAVMEDVNDKYLDPVRYRRDVHNRLDEACNNLVPHLFEMEGSLFSEYLRFVFEGFNVIFKECPALQVAEAPTLGEALSERLTSVIQSFLNREFEVNLMDHFDSPFAVLFGLFSGWRIKINSAEKIEENKAILMRYWENNSHPFYLLHADQVNLFYRAIRTHIQSSYKVTRDELIKSHFETSKNALLISKEFGDLNLFSDQQHKNLQEQLSKTKDECLERLDKSYNVALFIIDEQFSNIANLN